MSHHISPEHQNIMRVAVDLFDESQAVNDNGTARDYEKATTAFWSAFALWAPEALVGDFSMTTHTDTGEVYIHFRTK